MIQKLQTYYKYTFVSSEVKSIDLIKSCKENYIFHNIWRYQLVGTNRVGAGRHRPSREIRKRGWIPESNPTGPSKRSGWNLEIMFRFIGSAEIDQTLGQMGIIAVENTVPLNK